MEEKKKRAYKPSMNKYTSKYDKNHYKQVLVKIPFEMYDKMLKCKRDDEPDATFIKRLINDEIKNNGIDDD